MADNQEHRIAKRFFEDNIAHFSGQYRQAVRALEKTAFTRLLVLLLGLVGVVFFANAGAPGGTLMVAGTTAVVLALLQKKRNVRTQLKETAALYVSVNHDEVARSGLDLEDLPEEETHAFSRHPYGPDLDIVGEHSLFALLNRIPTAFGRKKLAAWLLNPADGPLVYARQRAVQELTGKGGWLQQFQVTGRYHQQRMVQDGLAAALLIIATILMLLAMNGILLGGLPAPTWLLLAGCIYSLEYALPRGLQPRRIGGFGPAADPALRTVATLDEVQEIELVNYRFETDILGDQIRFDYKLRDGPCQTANAAALMRQLGIGVWTSEP